MASHHRSSLSEALEQQSAGFDSSLKVAVTQRVVSEEETRLPESPFQTDTQAEHEEGSTDTFMTPNTFLPRKSGIEEAQTSPFTPDDPVYELCAESFQEPQVLLKGSSIGSSSSALGTLPEEGPASPDILALPKLDTATLLSPEKLKLPQVKTPRKPVSHVDSGAGPMDFEQRAANWSEMQTSLTDPTTPSESGTARSCVFKPSDPDAFNPFATNREATLPQDIPQASLDEEVFPMDVGSIRSPPAAYRGLESFGSIPLEPYQDPPEEQTLANPRETLQQLMLAVEEMINEVESSNQKLAAQTVQTKRSSDLTARIQEELDEMRAEELDAEARLRVMHSQLEAHLLSNLTQEDQLRVDGETLRNVKSKIERLDVSLSSTEEKRRALEAKLAEIRHSKNPLSQAEHSREDKNDGSISPHSNVSSAWETSDSELEAIEDTTLSPAPTTLSEDNQTKMSQQGAKGGSWLRGVMVHRSRKEELPPPLQDEPESTDTPTGGGRSHFQLPTTAAEYEKTEEDLLAENMKPLAMLGP